MMLASLSFEEEGALAVLQSFDKDSKAAPIVVKSPVCSKLGAWSERCMHPSL